MTAWYEDQQMRDTLTDLGVTFSFNKRIPLKDLSFNESKSNNARLGGEPIVDGHERFAIQMKDGQRFPCIVTHKLPNGKFYIDAGMNRVAAVMKTNDKTVAGFIIIGATRKQLELLRRSDNAKHGFGQTESESIEHCLELNKQGEAIGKLAKTFGIPLSKLRLAKKADEVLIALNTAGVSGAEKLPRTTRAKMHKFLGTTKILADMARSILRFHPISLKDADRLIAAIRNTKTMDAMTRAINRWETKCLENYQPDKKHTRSRRRRRDRIRRELILEGGFADFIKNGCTNASGGHGPFCNATDLQISDPADFAECNKAARKLVQQLRVIFDIPGGAKRKKGR